MNIVFFSPQAELVRRGIPHVLPGFPLTLVWDCGTEESILDVAERHRVSAARISLIINSYKESGRVQ